MKTYGVICCESVKDHDNLRYALMTMEAQTTTSMFHHTLTQMGVVPHKIPDHPLISTFGKGKSKRQSVFYRKIRSPCHRSTYQISWKRRSDSKVSSTPKPVRQQCMEGSRVSDTESDDVVIKSPPVPQAEKRPRLVQQELVLPPLLAVPDLARENERLKDVLAERERYVATLEAQLALKDKQLKALAATL